MRIMVALPDMVVTCREALHLYPGDEFLLKALDVGLYMFRQRDRNLAESGKSREERKEIVIYGGIFGRSYP